MTRPHILIADDEPHMLRLIAFALKPVDATLLTVTSGLDALQTIREQPIDLALFDVHMKDVDGLTAIQQLRADPAHQHLPIILLTSAGETHVEEQGRQLGVRAFFRKPFSPAQLANCVRQILSAGPAA